MALVIKSPDAEIFWEGIGAKGRSMYINSINEDEKYVNFRWQDMPKPIRSELGREMNLHYRKPKLPKGAWRGVESKKIGTHGSDQTRGITGGQEGTTVPNVKILHPKKKERENGTKPNVKQVKVEEKIAPIIGAAVGAAGAIAGRAIAGAALRQGKKIISRDDDEEKAVINKPFGRYKNWQACKDDSKSDSYCGWLKSKLEKRENKELLIKAIQESGGGIIEGIFQAEGICPCSLQGMVIGNKTIVKYNNLVSFIMLDDRSSSGQMRTINKYNPAGGSYYDDASVIKIGDQVVYAGGEGQVITYTGNYVTILREDKTKDMVHVRSVIRKTDIVYTEKSGLTCWNGINVAERQTILQKCKLPLSFISKDWNELPMNLKNVIQARFGQPVAKKEHKEEDKDKEKKKQTLETSNVGVDQPKTDKETAQETAFNEARTLYFEIKDTWGGSVDIGRFVRDKRESERKWNKDWLQTLERKINNAITLGVLHYKLGVLSIVDTTKADSKKQPKEKVSEHWPNYGDAGDAGNRDNSTHQGAGQDYSSNVKRGKKKQIRNDDRERKNRKDGENISEHDKADDNMTSDTSGVSNPVYGGEEKKPKKKEATTSKKPKQLLGGSVGELATAVANQATGTGVVQQVTPKKPKAGKQTGTKPTSTTSDSSNKQPVRKERQWTVGVPENVPIHGIKPFIVKEQIDIDEIASEYYRPIEQDANFKNPDRMAKPTKTPKPDKPPKMGKPQAHAGAYAA